MEPWTKLYQRILASSVWKLPSDIRIVWITMLALKDECGCVYGTVGWLADQARVEIEVCREAISIFLAPDERSRTPDNDGRKIEAIKGGWVILNHQYYRDGIEMQRDKWKRQKKAQRIRKGEEGLSMREIINKRVREDPVTIADQEAMKKFDEPPKPEIENGEAP